MIDIIAINQKRNEISRMVVKMGINIVSNPVMNSYGITQYEKCPPIEIGGGPLLQFFFPTQLKR